MAKKKTLGEANMEIPSEELILAEAIANSEEKGLPFCRGETGLLGYDREVFEYRGSGGCCLIGAYMCGRPHFVLASSDAYADFQTQTGLPVSDVYAGNDSEDKDIEENLPARQASRGFHLGAAYRAYHLESND